MSLTPYLPDLDVYANILLNPVLNHQIKNGRTETLKNILNLSFSWYYIYKKNAINAWELTSQSVKLD